MGIFRYDWVLVIDTEDTCYENNRWPEGEQQDVIEFGITEVDLRNRTITRSESLLVKPLRSRVSEYCTQLTGWTQEDVDKGMSLLEATQILQQKYDSRNRLWLSQGEFDRVVIKENCASLGVPYPFSKRHLNMQTLYSLLTGHGRAVGMMRQLERLGLEHEGKHHNGCDDSRNIARVFLEVLKRGHIKL